MLMCPRRTGSSPGLRRSKHPDTDSRSSTRRHRAHAAAIVEWTRVRADFLIRNTSEVVTCAGPAPRIGRAQAQAGSCPHAVVAADKGTIGFVRAYAAR